MVGIPAEGAVSAGVGPVVGVVGGGGGGVRGGVGVAETYTDR